MKRLLVLSYYFPPLGMSGVQRTLKFVKYLPQFGWQPVVLTIKPRGSYGYDPALLDEIPGTEIVRTFSFDPLYLSPSKHSPSAAARRGMVAGLNRFFIPDNKLGWIPFAVNRGLSLAKEQSIDAIYSTAPPFSSHLAALALKRKLGKPLICDFRDAWTQNPMASYASPLHKWLDRSLERKVLKNADRVLAINQEILDSFVGMHPGVNSDKFRVLPQGFDPADFEGVAPIKRSKFTIVYTGTFVEKRTPEPLLRALALIRDKQPDIFSDIQVIFAGAYRQSDKEMVRSAGMDKMVEFKGYVPHKESLALLKSADLLWLVIHPSEGKTVATGKLYEYLGAQKPILASVPEGGAAAELVNRTKTGQVFSLSDSMSAKDYMVELYKNKGRGLISVGSAFTASYDRRGIAHRLSNELDTMVTK
jgi:glycosyltransferase involved in cell wall biosynthesis